MTPEDVKTCCADLYASDWARLLLGESFHPGGLALTERLGTLLGLGPESHVLDVAAGRGTSALHLADTFGCRVVGVDYSAENVDAAPRSDRVQLLQGDAECLVDFADASFDAVICECALCTFPDKRAAAREIGRVLRPSGRFGLADLTRHGPLPAELDGLLAWIACVGDALPVDDYVGHLESAGLRITYVEAHDEALSELVRQVRGRLLAAEVLNKLQNIDLPGVDFAQAKTLARCVAAAVERGILGYSLILATKPMADSRPLHLRPRRPSSTRP